MPTYHEAIGVDDVEREESRHHTNDGRHRSKPERKNESFGEGEGKEKMFRRRSEHEGTSDVIWIPRDSPDSNTEPTNEEADNSEPGAHYTNVAETLDPTFQRIHHRSPRQLVDDSNDRQGSNKTAPIVPPVKRSSKDKTKRDKDKECKQQ